MLARMDAIELAEWQAFYNIEPFCDRRQDLQHAIVASTIYNLLRRKGRAKSVADFMPEFNKGKMSQGELNTKIMETFKNLKVKARA